MKLYVCSIHVSNRIQLAHWLAECFHNPTVGIQYRANYRPWLKEILSTEEPPKGSFIMQAEDDAQARERATKAVMTLLEYENSEELNDRGKEHEMPIWEPGAVSIHIQEWVVQPTMVVDDLRESFLKRLQEQRQKKLEVKERAELARLKTKYGE